MRRKIQSKPITVIAMLVLTGALITSCSSSPEQLNQEGNEAFVKQAYEEALGAYESAQIEAPELAEPYYNAANALYRQEKYAEALEQMQKALSYAKDEQLAESSRFNIGNTSYNTQEWEAAVESYKEALLLDPGDQDAKYNLELALQQQQQQEQNQEQQQDQSENNEGQEDEQQQEQEQDQSDQQQEQDQSQEGDQQQEQEQDQSDQQQDQEQSKDRDQQQEPNQPQNGENQEGQDQPQNQQPQPGQMPPPGQRMTAEQARQLLEAIAQDTDTLQERLGQFYFVPTRPSIQDW